MIVQPEGGKLLPIDGEAIEFAKRAGTGHVVRLRDLLRHLRGRVYTSDRLTVLPPCVGVDHGRPLFRHGSLTGRIKLDARGRLSLIP